MPATTTHSSRTAGSFMSCGLIGRCLSTVMLKTCQKFYNAIIDFRYVFHIFILQIQVLVHWNYIEFFAHDLFGIFFLDEQLW